MQGLIGDNTHDLIYHNFAFGLSFLCYRLDALLTGDPKKRTEDLETREYELKGSAMGLGFGIGLWVMLDQEFPRKILTMQMKVFGSNLENHSHNRLAVGFTATAKSKPSKSQVKV